MKIYGDDGKIYASEALAAEADKKLAEQKAEAEAKAKKLAETRKARAKEIEEAYTHYSELVAAFVKDYGSYHFSYKSDNLNRLFDDAFKFLF